MKARDRGAPMKLWPFQSDAIQAYETLSREHQRIVLVLPTGAGKTVVASEIIRRALGLDRRWNGKPAGRVLFLALPREQVDQAVAKLVAWGAPAGLIGTILARDDRSSPEAPIQVATLGTLLARNFKTGDMPPAGLVVIDEAHHSVAPTYRAVLARYPKARVLGLTATPMRLDGRGLADAGFQGLLVGATPMQLGIEGYLAMPRMWGPGEKARVDLKGVRVEQGDFAQAESSRRMGKPTIVGRHVSHYEELGGGHSAVVYACTKLHAKKIARRFRKAGHPVALLFGDTPLEERRALLRRLDSGERLVVVNVGVLTEGWDCPAAKVCILARPTRSWMLYMQMVGRFLRPWKGVTPIVLDHAGNRLRHGPPEQNVDYQLVMPKRAKSTEPSPEKECPICGAFVATGTVECPECGHEFEIDRVPKEQAGTLVEYVPTEEEKASVLATIRKVAEARGADEAWVQKVYETRFRGTS